MAPVRPERLVWPVMYLVKPVGTVKTDGTVANDGTVKVVP